MKKFLILFLCLFLNVKVKALIDYTDYEFVKYSKEKGEETELYKYEPVTINRFYKIIEKNVTYRESGTLKKDEIIDYSDFILQSYFSKYRQYRYQNYFVTTYNLENSFKIDTIEIQNLITNTSLIQEIEIKTNDILVDYDILDHEFLKDGNKSSGKKINGNNIKLNLKKETEIQNIEIFIYYASRNTEDSTFELILSNSKTKQYKKEKISFSMYYSENKIYKLNFMLKEKFTELLTINEFATLEESYSISKFSYVIYFKKLYKHYFLEKSYYLESDELEIDGYIFDANESYKGYKVYKRNILERKDLNEKENLIEEEILIENVNTEISDSTNLTGSINCNEKNNATIISQTVENINIPAIKYKIVGSRDLKEDTIQVEKKSDKKIKYVKIQSTKKESKINETKLLCIVLLIISVVVIFIL